MNSPDRDCKDKALAIARGLYPHVMTYLICPTEAETIS